MSLSQRNAIERANKNFRYSWLYFVIATCISIYYFGVAAWIASQNNWNFSDYVLIDFIQVNDLARGLMIGFLALTLISLVFFTLGFLLIFVNSIRILFSSRDVSAGTKFWAFFSIIVCSLTLLQLILSVVGYAYPNNRLLSIIINWFSLLGPFLLLISTGCCKWCVNR